MGWDDLFRDQQRIVYYEDEQRYSRDGIYSDITVNELLSKIFPFDSEAVARRCVLKKTKKYVGVTVYRQDRSVDVEASVKNILMLWSYRAQKSTEVHRNLFKYFSKHRPCSSTLHQAPCFNTEEEGNVEQEEEIGYRLATFDNLLFNLLGCTRVGNDVKLFSEKFINVPGKEGRQTLAGSIDMLCHNKEGNAIIVEWTVSALRFDGGELASEPLNKFPNVSYWKNSAKLNLCALLLEHQYNIKTDDKYVVFFEDLEDDECTFRAAPAMHDLRQLFK